MKYTIDTESDGEGGCAEFYRIKENPNLGFKQFRNKTFATSAYKKQKMLSKLGLAPKVYGKVCKIKIEYPHFSSETNWGYITEKAKICKPSLMEKRLKQIQSLVEDIEKNTKLKFWDCHYWNIGYITRKNKAKLVCIDTGTESFDPDCNAWGNENPGPKCTECNNFFCECSKYY